MGSVEIPKWLKGLPFAPEFRPTDTEFSDPIAYIAKIEKEASAYGICKVIPPFPKPSKRYVFANLNKSLSKCPELVEGVDLSNVGSSSKTGLGVGDGGNDVESRAVFTTRQQELGQAVKRMKGLVRENQQLGVHKQVWQSGEVYTLEQFESKSKAFARSLLGMIKEVNPLVVEALFWKAASEKPIFVEYANDVPGSGFGEPEGQFRYFRRRRRKRASYQSYRRRRESPNGTKKEMDSVNNSSHDDVDGETIIDDKSTSSKTTPGSCVTSSSSFSEETLSSSKRRSINVSNDMVGTAGWKLSNSPWNLQVIARSPGSLTRFMPDDIPGVTSPMVYIGMLFSWFAWHVEDHELHSLNYLHTGSAKTWYAVPGDHAFAFEEVIRTEAYGGNIDRLATLTLLGEKTTLLSPEIVVSSGIPCCRLVQNPGEFVVTFPRAYHVGFSHGFNCGEAANFGTPQWLEVAKEAAVRRAAMNYLPMLSHQQLLYLLTMSFVSRVPRSLLPGARSSRLRDRQKEERELSVKKAFIEDLLKGNDILSALLEKNSSYNVVTWNPDLLPCASKVPEFPSVTASIQTSPQENTSPSHPECNRDSNESDLFKEMSLYMETLNDLYGDNDLSCDFQVDSGTLACVACGILGFPFMSVVQPSEKASVELLPVDHLLVEDGSGVTRSGMCNSLRESNITFKGSVGEDLSLPQKDITVPKGWTASRKFLRPRIFCLEHGIQVEELLQSKGGANMLIICHSDFQKMKAHATAIADEIQHPFRYNEVPLENASQDDLNLIDLAIDDEDRDECGEDWTSKLGINLRYCVKVRKNSPSTKVQHALALGGLFSDKSTCSRFLNLNWQSRRSRSRIILSHPSQCQPLDIETNKEVEGIKSEVLDDKKGKLIQYTRRKYKVSIDGSSGFGQVCPSKHLAEISVTNCEDLQKKTVETSVINAGDVGFTGSGSTGFANSEKLHEVQLVEGSQNMNLDCSLLHVADPFLLATEGVERVVGQTGSQSLEESHNKNVSDGGCAIPESQHEIRAFAGVAECSSKCVIAADDICEPQEWNKQLETANTKNETPHEISEGQLNKLVDRDTTMNEASDLTYPESLQVSEPIIREMEAEAVDKSPTNNEYDHMTLDNEVQKERQIADGNNDDQCVISSDMLINRPLALVEERSERQQVTSAVEDEKQRELNIPKGSNEKELSLMDASLISQPLVSVDGSLDTLMDASVAAKHCNSEGGLESSTTKRCDVEELVPNFSDKVQDHHMPVLEECSGVPSRNCAAVDLPTDVNSKAEVRHGIQSSDEVTRDDGVNKIQQAIGSVNDDEPDTTQATQVSQPTSGMMERHPIVKEGSLTGQNVVKSSEDNPTQEVASTESTVSDPGSISVKRRKRKNEVEQITESKLSFQGFIRSPCEGLRPRAGKEKTNGSGIDVRKSLEDNPVLKRAREFSDIPVPRPKRKEITKRPHKCDLDGCCMSFVTKAELVLHKRNRCTLEGCRKRFSSHKYAIIHQRVHEDDRPLKCPWKGCSMSFKWAWARTEHLRVHTGEKPYQCKVEGCGLSFRFVSDYSRHRRKTGHYVN